MKKEHRLPQLPERTLAVLDRHRDDEDFWSLERHGIRTITETDESGRITFRVRAFVTADQSGADYYAFAYEEWQYLDNLGMAVMKRERMGGNEYTVRTYENGVMVLEVTATIYGDGKRVIKMTKPMNQPDGSVVYAAETYREERVKNGGIHPDTTARPAHLIELGSHCGEGKPVGLHDYHVEVDYFRYGRGVFDLKKQLDYLGVARASTILYEYGERPVVKVVDDELVIMSSLGEVSFPAEINFDQLFAGLRF